MQRLGEAVHCYLPCQLRRNGRKRKKFGHSDICYSSNFAFNIIHNYVIPAYDLASKQNPSYL